jgi:hypothetical protein
LAQLVFVVCGSVCHLNDITHHGVDFVVPASAAEDAVVANPRLHVVHLHILPQFRAKVLRGEGLAEAANIVPLAFDGQQSGVLDERADVDQLLNRTTMPRLTRCASS